MESKLKSLYQKDGKEIFQEKYRLLEKLLEFSDGPVWVQDAILVNKIVNGNKFYSIVKECDAGNCMMDRHLYNTLIDQMYAHDQLWQMSDIGRGEELLRYMLELCGMNLDGIKEIINVQNSMNITPEEQKKEYEYAYTFYLKKEYKEAFDILHKLVENGAHNAAGLLGILYYKGQGTIKDYNKALYYLSYPQTRDLRILEEETKILKELVDLKYRSKLSYGLQIIATVFCLIFMIVCGIFQTHTILAVFYAIIMSGVCILIGYAFKKKYIYDFSLWYLALGCMLMSSLVL